MSTTQQIQISDPELPENKEFVDFFMEVWFGILKDKEEMLMTCEFGPQPYMMNVPGTEKDVVDLDQVNLKMA